MPYLPGFVQLCVFTFYSAHRNNLPSFNSQYRSLWKRFSATQLSHNEILSGSQWVLMFAHPLRLPAINWKRAAAAQPSTKTQRGSTEGGENGENTEVDYNSGERMRGEKERENGRRGITQKGARERERETGDREGSELSFSAPEADTFADTRHDHPLRVPRIFQWKFCRGDAASRRPGIINSRWHGLGSSQRPGNVPFGKRDSKSLLESKYPISRGLVALCISYSPFLAHFSFDFAHASHPFVNVNRNFSW